LIVLYPLDGQKQITYSRHHDILIPAYIGMSSLYQVLNSLTPKSVPAGAKKILFGRYVLNIYVGIVRYFLRKTKTRRAKIYLPTQRTNRQISYDIN
jgi:hypothetical protein